ncbi:hypothetical protein [Oceanithermus sp.]|uniref:hypothetical protein n=1 Tax=Oceanithermus sp. TaxID=2268145 RepID=UPI00258085DF|nr:hypothetical protein [Oceanithermus sp.]
MPLETLLTPSYIRDRYLPGLPLLDSQGRPLPDETITQRVKAVVRTFERKYGIRLEPKTIKLGTYPFDDEDAFTVDERFPGVDWHSDQNKDHRHFIMRLPVGPIVEIHRVGLWMPGMPRPAVFPSDWVYPERSATVRIYVGKTLTYAIPQLSGIMMNLIGLNRPIPGGWHFLYRAGYTEEDLQGQDYDLLDALGKATALEVLTPGSLDKHFADGVTARNVSVDGLSQSLSLTNTPNSLKYQALIARYSEELATWEQTFWARKSGVRFGVV